MQATRIEGRQTNHNVKDFVEVLLELPGLTSSAYDDYFTMLATSAAEVTLVRKRKAGGDSDADAAA